MVTGNNLNAGDMPTESIGANQLRDVLHEGRRRELLEAVPEIIEGLLRQGILQSSWGGVLCAAPMAVQIMGSSFIVASSDVASSVKLKESRVGLDGEEVRILPWQTLRGNLTHCGNLGRRSFMEAQARMDNLSRLSSYMTKPNGTINMIIDLLDNPEAARYSLRRQMKRLQETADKCRAESQLIEQHFEQWLQFTCDLQEASVDRQQNSLEEKKLNETVKIVKESDKEQKTRQEEQYRNSLNSLQAALAVATADYQRAVQQVEEVTRRSLEPLPSADLSGGFDPVADLPQRESDGFISWLGKKIIGKTTGDIKEEEAYRAQFILLEQIKQNRLAKIAKAERKERERLKNAALVDVEQARKNLVLAQSGLSHSHREWDEGAENLQKATEALSEVTADLRKLEEEGFTLENISKILVKSIKALSQLKAQVGTLTSFYKEVAGIVDFTVGQPLKDFLETIDDGIEAGEHDLNNDARVERMRIHESQKRFLMSSALSIQSYFSVICEISSIYTHVSKRFIMPGMNLIDELALDGCRSVQDYHEKVGRLETWADKAMGDIADVADTKQDEIMNSLEERVRKIAGRRLITEG